MRMNSKSLVILGIILMALVLTSGCIKQSEDPLSLEKVNFQLLIEANGEETSQSISVPKGTNALEAMKMLADVNYSTSAFGAFVTSINGIANTSDSYWLFWIEGKFAEKAIDAYSINGDTVVIWRFLDAEESKKFWGS